MQPHRARHAQPKRPRPRPIADHVPGHGGTLVRRRPRNAPWWVLVALLVVALVGVVASPDSLPGLGHAYEAAGSAGQISWPVRGSAAAWVSSSGSVDGPSSAAREAPIASLAKVMTAYVVLRDHPLRDGSDGPDITVSSGEAAAHDHEAARGESLVPVAAGEILTEREALQALLLPSADNMAWILARWDAGSVGAFLDRMNATARGLGMRRTVYTDPSGLLGSTRSTAADQVRLGRAAVRLRALAAIVAQRTATIPVAGPIQNLNALLGVDGIVGMKTGSTSAAGGCVLLVARHGATTTIVAVLGQPGLAEQLLPRAFAVGRSLVVQTTAHTTDRRG